MEKLYAKRADLEVHPAGKRAAQLFFQEGKRRFTPEDLEELRAMIYGVSLGEVDELSWMCMSLWRFAAYLHTDLGETRASGEVLAALSVALPAIRDANEPIFQSIRSDASRAATARFRQLTGAEEEPVPASGQARSAGSLSLEVVRPRRVFR
jgi:hypothetical protein